MLDWLAHKPEIPALPPVQHIEVVREVERKPWATADLVRSALTGQIPRLSGRAFLVGDVATGEVLLKHREEQMLPIASLTKIMTVVVALERFGPEALVTVTREATAIEGAKVPLLLGDQLTVRELVVACIVRSGNDAAVALAAHAPGGTPEFVRWMNDKAASLQLQGVHFANPMGFDAPDHYGTVEGLFHLSRYALATHPLMREAAKLPEARIQGAMKTYLVSSTNALLGDGLLEILGFKTGTTEGAGQSLITLIKTPEGREVLGVVLGSKDRFAETKTLLWWLQQG